MGSGGCLGSQFFLPVRTIFTEQAADKQPFFSVSAPHLPTTSQAAAWKAQLKLMEGSGHCGWVPCTLVFRPLHEVQFTRAAHVLGK